MSSSSSARDGVLPRACEIDGTEPMRPVPTRGAFLAPVQGYRTKWEFRPKGDACRTSYLSNHFELDTDLVTYLRTTIAGEVPQ